jgi:hypothetical protein
MLAVRTPGAPQAAREDAAFDSAFPFERQGRLLRSRSISGLFSRSLHSGLQPPCLRFATAVTGRHARLGSRLLARLCRGRHLRRQTSTRLQGATLTDPDLILSHHPARAIARRLPPSAEPSGSSRYDPVGPSSTAMTRPLRSTSITPASSLLQGSPPLSGASVLSASRLEPLVLFPLASPARFSRSIQEPG